MVECPVCGKSFKALSSHIRASHSLTTCEFRALFPEHPMVSEETKLAVSETCKMSGVGTQNKGVRKTEEFKQHLSKKFTGEGNPFHGKTHREETRIKMSTNHADFSGDNNPLRKSIERGDTDRDHLSYIRKQVWHDIKSDTIRFTNIRERFSNGQSERIAKGHNSFTRHKSGWYFSEVWMKDIYYQSSYELKFIRLCEKSSFILNIDRCTLRIPYFFEITRHYVPDFVIEYVGGLSEIIEIKPKSMLSLEQNVIKFSALEAYCIENNKCYSIVTEDVLFNSEEENDV